MRKDKTAKGSEHAKSSSQSKPPKKTRSRSHKKPLDENMLKQVRALAGIHCTQREIALVLGLAERTIRKYKAERPEFLEAIEIGEAEGKSSLRKAQYQKAISGNATMQIWLGKQWLGQLDKPLPEEDKSAQYTLIVPPPGAGAWVPLRAGDMPFSSRDELLVEIAKQLKTKKDPDPDPDPDPEGPDVD